MPLHNNTHRDALPIRLGNRKFNIDVTRLARQTIDPIRQGFDTVGQPGEQSLNQAGVWKRSRNDWELGAGQREADSPESGLRRFHTSLGIDPWTKNEIKLHKNTESVKTASGTTLLLTTANDGTDDYIYMSNGANVEYSTNNGTTWGSAIANPAGGTIFAMASDGASIYVAGNAGVGSEVQKISTTTAGSGTGNVWSLTGMALTDGVWFANGYLIASVGSRLTWLPSTADESSAYDITSSTFSQVSTWSSVIGTPVGIYAAGNQGNQGRIYYIGINDSTVALDVPVLAAPLPEGETINVLSEYGGVILIGTNKGFRLAQTGQRGTLSFGPLVTIDNGVSVLEPQGEFVWFGWKNYEGNSGLGRISLKEFTEPLVPAYATDLMKGSTNADIQGVITTADDRRLFTISGDGAYIEHDTNYVSSGTISEGRFRWGITELKVPVSGDIRHNALITGESITLTVTSDDGQTDTITSDTVGKSTPVDADGNPNVQPFDDVDGEYLIPSLTITRGTDATKTPTVFRWTVRAIPMPFVAEVITLPIVLTTQTEHEDRHAWQDVYEEYSYIKSLLEKRALALFIMGAEVKNVYVAGVGYDQGAISKWSASQQREYKEGYGRDRWVEGVLTVQLITVQTGVTLTPSDTA
jgi:hypothetical protein